MLSTQAMQSAQAIVNNLDSRNLIVAPLQGSVLEILVGSSGVAEAAMMHARDDHSLDVGYLSDLSGRPDPLTGYASHTVDMEEIVAKVADAVTNHLKHARTVVAPMVDELVQRIVPLLEQAAQTSMSDLEVSVYSLPAPMLEPALIDSAMRAKDIAPAPFVFDLALPQYSAAQIIEAMKSGVVSLDAAIDSWAGALAPEQLEAIWQQVFTRTPATINSADVFNNAESGLTTALVAFLVARKLWNNAPDDTNMSAREYEDRMVEVRDQSALRLIREFNVVERDERNGVLVRKYTRNKVEVNAKVYKTWLENGGTNELLFGNILSSRPAVMGEDILAKASECQDAWNRYTMLNRTVEAGKRFNAAKNILRVEATALLSNLSQDELPLQNRQMVVKQFEDALACTKEDEVLRPYDWVLRVLCESLYRQSDARRILEGINRVMAHSPGVDVREAAAVSAVEYIAWWLSQQFKVQGAVG